MSDAQQPHQGNLANPLVLALEISSSALLHVSKEPFLRAAMASIGESLHCEQVSLVEFDDDQWSAPVVWRSGIRSATADMPAATLTNICSTRLMGRDTPCPFCTNAIIAASSEPYQWTYENKTTRRTYTVVDKAIRWDNDKTVRLSISRDVTDLLQTQHEKQDAVVASQAKSGGLALMSQ